MDAFSFDPATLATTVQTLLADWGLKLLGAIAVFFIGRIVAGALRGAMKKGLQRADFDPTLVPFLTSLTYTAVLAMVILTALSVAGVPVTSFVAVIGAAGLAVALAFQGTLSNFSAGVMLLTFRPFRIGDFIEGAGTSGTVKEIGIFTTTMATPDNVQIIVPNSQLFDDTLKNYSANEDRRIDLVMGVGYDDDLDLAIRTIHDIIGEDERVLAEPEPQVAVSNLGASSVDIVVRPWVKGSDYWGARFDLTKALKEGLEAAGCNIPYPQRDVHLFHENAPKTED
jgi:small conductance mechanosensitive channel